MKVVRPIKMRLKEIYSKVWVGKHLNDMFPIENGLRQGDALTPLLFNLALLYAITRVQVNKDGLKINRTHQRLVYADDVRIWGRSIHTIKRYEEALELCSKEMGLDVYADKTKYMLKSQDQNAGRSHNMKIYNSSFERVEKFQYFGTTLMNQTSIQEEIKSR